MKLVSEMIQGAGSYAEAADGNVNQDLGITEI